MLPGCIAHLTLLPTWKGKTNGFTITFGHFGFWKCSYTYPFKPNASENDVSRACSLELTLLSHYVLTTKTILTKKQKEKRNNMYLIKVNIKWGLMELSGPFPHFLHSKQWFHQDKSLKSVITLIFFLNNKKAWVGRERNSQKKPEKGKEGKLI